MTQNLRVPVIAIDGHSGAGKGTVRQIIAKELSWNELDSGSLYRVIAYQAIKSSSGDYVCIARDTIGKLKTSEGEVWLDGVKISKGIRSPEVDMLVPEIAKIKEVRETILTLQISMRSDPGLVAEGRDMCYIFDTPYRFFITAASSVRAERRIRQMEGKGVFLDYDTIRQAIIRRDYIDQNREISPLKVHPRAVFIDTSHADAHQVARRIMEICKL